MRKPILLLTIVVSILTACASGPAPMPAPKLMPPESSLVVCPPLPPPSSGALTDLLTNHILTAKAYHQCRDLHQALIDWLEATDALR